MAEFVSNKGAKSCVFTNVRLHAKAEHSHCLSPNTRTPTHTCTCTLNTTRDPQHGHNTSNHPLGVCACVCGVHPTVMLFASRLSSCHAIHSKHSSRQKLFLCVHVGAANCDTQTAVSPRCLPWVQPRVTRAP